MHFLASPNQLILRCANPVLIIDLLTATSQFIVPGNYIPDLSNLEEEAFHLLPECKQNE
jgi:hypothetical protein